MVQTTLAVPYLVLTEGAHTLAEAEHTLHILGATPGPDLLRRRGRPTDALPHYRRALELAPSDAERRFLQRRLDELETLGRP